MKFKVNGKEYEGAKYDFNTHCEFDSMGVNPLMLKDNPLPVIRAYLAISSGMTLTEAGNELEKHFIGGGDFTEIIVNLAKELNESDFFTAIMKMQMPETSQTTETSTEKSEAKTKRGKTTKRSVKSTSL